MRPANLLTHVLAFVEDEERASVIKSLLSGVQGITIELAYTVSHIQRYSAAAPVDVIFLDLKDAAPLEALQLIRSLGATGTATEHIPLTALFDADSDAELRLNALDAGLLEVFVEPLDEIHLLTRLVLFGRIRQAEDAIRQLAIIDPVTGLFDQRYFLLRLGEELSRARRYARPLTCVVCALDDLPGEADAASCEARVRMLRQATVILQAEKRDIDVLGRMGDGEFAMLLYNTDIPGAVVLCERVRSQLGHLDSDELGGRFGFSAGIAAVQPKDEVSMHPEEFRQRAELALEQARSQGGGCNVIFSPDLTRRWLTA